MLLFVVVVAFGAISYVSVEQASTAIANERVTTLADKLTVMFKGSFDEFAAVPVAVADDNNVRAYLNNPTRQNSLASQDVFKKLIQKDTTNRLVQLLNASKQVVLSSGGKVSSLRVNIDSLASPSMAKGVNFNVGKLVVLNGSMYFPAVARVTDSNKVIGYVVNWKVMKATPQAVDQLAQLLGANGRLYFGNDDGQFWTDLVKPVEKPPVEIAKLQGVARYSRKTSGAVIASVRKIPDSRWMMVVELSGASFHETASIFLRWMTALGIVLILIGSIGGWLMSRSITGPLKQLSGAAAAIAEGDYSKHVNIDREDELGMLADSFNIMSARVYAAQRELEQMVEERTRDLQTAITDIKDQKETDRKKDEFISIASHELKTPLTTLKAFFQLAGREMQPQLKSYNFFGNASRQLNRMERLITDLLDVSKINSGKMQYNFEEFDIERLLKDTIESAQQISPGHRLILERSIPVNVKGDRHRIEQVIVNLLSNAVKYSPEADKVLIRLELKGNKVSVIIKDFGIGISKKHIVGLFDRYYRIEGSEYRFQGLGLGLFISSEILKRHNGTISVQSEPGKGSTFAFELPV